MHAMWKVSVWKFNIPSAYNSICKGKKIFEPASINWDISIHQIYNRCPDRDSWYNTYQFDDFQVYKPSDKEQKQKGKQKKKLSELIVPFFYGYEMKSQTDAALITYTYIYIYILWRKCNPWTRASGSCRVSFSRWWQNAHISQKLSMDKRSYICMLYSHIIIQAFSYEQHTCRWSFNPRFIQTFRESIYGLLFNAHGIILIFTMTLRICNTLLRYNAPLLEHHFLYDLWL